MSRRRSRSAGTSSVTRSIRSRNSWRRPPHQVWSWDLTKLVGPVTWSYGYRYVSLDIFSRYVVGWMVALAESAVLAQRLITDTCEKPQIGTGPLTLPADRGSSMTSNPVAWLLADLGGTNTHRRPYPRDDNPFSEAQFKTLTYRPDFPARFGSLDDARVFCQTFCSWDNGEHRHSGIGLMTPAVVHDGRANTMRDARQQGLMTASAAHPERFVRKPPQPPILPHAVWIHPPKEPSASQDGTEATSSIADEQRVALKVEGLGVVSETVIVSPHTITMSTDEVLH